MDIQLVNSNKKIFLSNKIFNVNINMNLIHQVIVSYQANKRNGNVSQKSRSDVTGSNKKPWRQKGTGKARSGSVKSPIWRSGGVTFASKPKKYNLKVNKKMYRNAFKMILSDLINNSKLYIIKNVLIDKPKTKLFIKYFNFIKIYRCLIVVKNIYSNLLLSSRNLYKFKICDVNHINIIDLVTFKSVVFELDIINILEKRFL